MLMAMKRPLLSPNRVTTPLSTGEISRRAGMETQEVVARNTGKLGKQLNNVGAFSFSGEMHFMYEVFYLFISNFLQFFLCNKTDIWH